MEMAMQRYPDGAMVQRLDAFDSYKKFLEARQKAGGKSPRDRFGSMLWDSSRGWVSRGERRVTPTVGGSSVRLLSLLLKSDRTTL
jgi:hypothetical protein